MSSVPYPRSDPQCGQITPMALPLPHQLQLQQERPPLHQYYPHHQMPPQHPQRQPLIVDPYSIHHHNNVVNINNISMHSIPSHNISSKVPPPHKKRKLNNNFCLDSTKDHQYKAEIRSLQQRLDESVAKNKKYSSQIQHFFVEMNEIQSKNAKQLQIINICRSKELKTMAMLKQDVESMKMSRFNQLNIIKNKDSEIIELKKKLKKKDEEIADLKSKYREIKRVTAHLYLECVNGEEPRWDIINVEKTENGMIRDKQLSDLHQKIRSLYRNDSYRVYGIGKWRNNKRIIDSVKTFIKLNGEYNREPMMILNNINIERYNVIQKFKIKNNHRISALNGQFGIKAIMDIPSNTVCGQYFGAEMSLNAFAKVFDGTAVEHDHNVYALDQQIDNKEIQKVYNKFKDKMDDDNDGKSFVIDPFVVEDIELFDKLCLPFINDCRSNINHHDPFKEDADYYNIEFVGVKFNGWTQTYLITKRDIKKGEELMTYYGTVFGVAVKNKMQNEEAKQCKKIRIDREILQELKHEFQATFRLCKYI